MSIVSPSMMIVAACADTGTGSAKRQRNSWKVHVNLYAMHHSDFWKNSAMIQEV